MGSRITTWTGILLPDIGVPSLLHVDAGDSRITGTRALEIRERPREVLEDAEEWPILLLSPRGVAT
eukprot:3261167-Rhodomonas_salina.1